MIIPVTNGSQDGPEKEGTGTPDGASHGFSHLIFPYLLDGSSQKAVLEVLALIVFVLASSQRWWISTRVWGHRM